MKSVFTLCVAVVVLFSLVGCVKSMPEPLANVEPDDAVAQTVAKTTLLEKFEAIEFDMAYDEIIGILGDSGGQNNIWHADPSEENYDSKSISLSFDDGVLDMKKYSDWSIDIRQSIGKVDISEFYPQFLSIELGTTSEMLSSAVKDLQLFEASETPQHSERAYTGLQSTCSFLFADDMLFRKVTTGPDITDYTEVPYSSYALISPGDSYQRVCELCGVDGLMYAEEILSDGTIRRSIYFWLFTGDGISRTHEAIFENDSLISID